MGYPKAWVIHNETYNYAVSIQSSPNFLKESVDLQIRLNSENVDCLQFSNKRNKFQLCATHLAL